MNFLFGLARNARRVDRIHVDLARAGAPAVPPAASPISAGSTRDSWSRKRRVVAKAEWMPRRGEAGANPRFIVTLLPATGVGARALSERL